MLQAIRQKVGSFNILFIGERERKKNTQCWNKSCFDIATCSWEMTSLLYKNRELQFPNFSASII